MRIKEVLKENGCTQQMLADRMNISLSAVKQMVAADSLTTSTLEVVVITSVVIISFTFLFNIITSSIFFNNIINHYINRICNINIINNF